MSWLDSDCDCGMCGFGGNPFSTMFVRILGGFGGFGDYDGYDDYNPWANRREKSTAAQSREDSATREFFRIKGVVERVLLEKTKVVPEFKWFCCKLQFETLLTL